METTICLKKEKTGLGISIIGGCDTHLVRMKLLDLETTSWISPTRMNTVFSNIFWGLSHFLFNVMNECRESVKKNGKTSFNIQGVSEKTQPNNY